MLHTTSKVFMVKPVRFGFNPQTADNNTFQVKGFEEEAQQNALREFTSYVTLLRANKIDVVVAQDTEHPYTPDSIFPNNWFSTHTDGTLVIYPIYAKNRRNERKAEFLDLIRKNFDVKRVIDLSWWENENLYLEGTGSMIFDRINNIVYACESPRTSKVVLDDFCKQLGYTPVFFKAFDQNGCPVYHTNVMMSVGTQHSIICTESITDADQRNLVMDTLKKSGKKVLEINFNQMHNFAGNMMELHNKEGRQILVMSGTARKSLTPEQIKELNNHYKLLSPQLDYIEKNGGGSARCMIAELF